MTWHTLGREYADGLTQAPHQARVLLDDAGWSQWIDKRIRERYAVPLWAVRWTAERARCSAKNAEQAAVDELRAGVVERLREIAAQRPEPVCPRRPAEAR